jgi:outer membrane protein OmpA-like peptidoglycan-associated protein
MRIYPRHFPVRPSRFAAIAVACFALILAATPATAQRRYLVEIGAAAAYQTFDEATNLRGAPGGIARLGVWLPYRFSLELEGGVSSPSTEAEIDASVTSFFGSLLYNIPIGRTTTGYARAGIGAVGYGRCPPISIVGDPPCGSAGAFSGGLGFRLGLTPTLLLRSEGALIRSTSLGLTNFSLSVGASLMLGSVPIVDTDGDGVLDSSDKCASTPAGTLVDRNGCPTDNDKDGVADGLDRCPTTPEGAGVDDVGCPVDSDKDNVPDGLDRCDNTPAGAAVDERGCPADSDNDGVSNGLDRCEETPAGASVDQLGCPGDGDGDGVLDGLDRCPDTPSGTRVNSFGCRPGEVGNEPRRQGAAAAPADSAPTGVTVLKGVVFPTGSARLPRQALPVLDSVAAVLLANPALRFQIAAHTDERNTPAENSHLSQLRAEAVRNYLISKGVPFQWLTAQGYGATEPLTSDSTAAGRLANRRIELRPVPTAP